MKDKLNLTAKEAENIWIYSKKTDGTLEIVGYWGQDEDVVIPRTIDGVAVTSLYLYSLASFCKPVNVFIHDLITDEAVGGGWGFVSSAITGFGKSSNYLSFTVDENNPSISSIDGSLYSKDGKALLIYKGASKDASFTLPPFTEKIRGCAFEGAKNLCEVNLFGVKSVGHSAFSDCSNLNSVNFGTSLCEIGNAVLDGTGYYNDENNWENGLLYVDNYLVAAKEITTGELYIKKGTRAIADGIFSRSLEDSDGVNSVYFDGTVGEWCSGEYEAALGTGRLPKNIGALYVRNGDGEYEAVSELVIPDTVESVIPMAFSGYSAMKSVTFGKKTKHFGNDAFKNCKGLCRVNYDGTVDDWLKIKFENLFSNPLTHAKSLYLRGQDGEWQRLEILDIPSGVTEIPAYALAGCDITGVKFPETLSKIADAAFYACTRLLHVSLPDSVMFLGSQAFVSGALISVALGRGIKEISPSCFTNKYGLVEIINNSECDVNSAYALDIHSGKSRIVNDGGYLFYTKDGKNYLVGYEGEETSLSLPASYKGEAYEIYKYAFVNNEKITRVAIPSGITIGTGAFSYCGVLAEVVLDSDTTLPRGAFEYCPKLNPDFFAGRADGVVAENGVFYGISGDVVVPKGVKRIEKGVLARLCGVKSITLPEALVGFDKADLPKQCRVLYKDRKGNPDLFVTDGDGVLVGLSERLVIPEGVTVLSDGMEGKTNVLTSYGFIKEINLPSTVLEIKTNRQSFIANCKIVKRYSMHGNNARFVCDDGIIYTLEKGALVKFPPAKTLSTFRVSCLEIAENAMADVRGVSSVVIGSRCQKIGAGAFAHTTYYGKESGEPCGIRKFYIPPSVKEIASDAFDILYDEEGFTYADVIIGGEVGSCAWEYANSNGIDFIPVDKDGLDAFIKATHAELKEKIATELDTKEYSFDFEGDFSGRLVGQTLEFRALDTATDGAVIRNVSKKLPKRLLERVKRLVIGNGISAFSADAFQYYRQLEEVYFGKDIKYIDANAFFGDTEIKKLTVDEKNSEYKSVDGVVFSHDLKTLVMYPSGREDGYYEIPHYVEIVGAYSMMDSRLKSIKFGSNVKAIGPHACYNTHGQYHIYVAPSVTSFGDEYIFGVDGKFGACTCTWHLVVGGKRGSAIERYAKEICRGGITFVEVDEERLDLWLTPPKDMSGYSTLPTVFGIDNFKF